MNKARRYDVSKYNEIISMKVKINSGNMTLKENYRKNKPISKIKYLIRLNILTILKRYYRFNHILNLRSIINHQKKNS